MHEVNTMVRRSTGPVTGRAARFFGLALGVFSAVLLSVGGTSLGVPLTPWWAAGYVGAGLLVGFVGARGLRLLT